MFSIGDASSLFEVGFALNLAAPTLYGALERARSFSLKPIIEGLVEEDPPVPMNAMRRAYLNKTIFVFYPGLKYVRRIAWALGVGSVISLSASIWLLLVGTLYPDNLFENAILYSYVVMAILILPAGYGGLAMLTTFIQRHHSERLEDSADARAEVVKFFRLMLSSDEERMAMMDKVREIKMKAGLALTPDEQLQVAERDRQNDQYLRLKHVNQVFGELNAKWRSRSKPDSAT